MLVILWNFILSPVPFKTNHSNPMVWGSSHNRVRKRHCPWWLLRGTGLSLYFDFSPIINDCAFTYVLTLGNEKTGNPGNPNPHLPINGSGSQIRSSIVRICLTHADRAGVNGPFVPQGSCEVAAAHRMASHTTRTSKLLAMPLMTESEQAGGARWEWLVVTLTRGGRDGLCWLCCRLSNCLATLRIYLKWRWSYS